MNANMLALKRLLVCASYRSETRTRMPLEPASDSETGDRTLPTFAIDGIWRDYRGMSPMHIEHASRRARAGMS